MSKKLINIEVAYALPTKQTIIDVASSRGAFKPNEMVQIGQTYNKLDSFLAAVAAQQPQSPEGA